MFDKDIRYSRKIEKIDNKIQYWQDLSWHGKGYFVPSQKIDKLEYKRRKYQNKLKENNSYIFKS